jgi:hypothetical protein
MAMVLDRGGRGQGWGTRLIIRNNSNTTARRTANNRPTTGGTTIAIRIRDTTRADATVGGIEVGAGAEDEEDQAGVAAGHNRLLIQDGRGDETMGPRHLSGDGIELNVNENSIVVSMYQLQHYLYFILFLFISGLNKMGGSYILKNGLRSSPPSLA